MNDGRELCPPATLETRGFELQSWPTRCTDFADEEEVVRTYYGEMMELVKSASGAERVFIFDHTLSEPQHQSECGGWRRSGRARPTRPLRLHCQWRAKAVAAAGGGGYLLSVTRSDAYECGGAGALQWPLCVY